MKAVHRKIRQQIGDLYSYVRGCEGKSKHPSKAMASAVLIAMVKRGDRNTNGLRPYKCKFCHRWHLGH